MPTQCFSYHLPNPRHEASSWNSKIPYLEPPQDLVNNSYLATGVYNALNFYYYSFSIAIMNNYVNVHLFQIQMVLHDMKAKPLSYLDEMKTNVMIYLHEMKTMVMINWTRANNMEGATH
jgi:hypothetical protein